MPLVTQIIRDGERLKMPHGWGWWHVICMSLQSQTDSSTDWSQLDQPIGASPLGQTGRWEVKYNTSYRDPSDGEVLTLRAGDRLEMWREVGR